MTIALAVQWARLSRSSNSAQAARRLAVVRQFARYRKRFDPATEVPPAGLLGRIPRRPPPHIYTETEMAALLRQASCLLPRHGLRPATYAAYFALLVSTGLRLSEACRLTTDDVDLANGHPRHPRNKIPEVATRTAPSHNDPGTDPLRRPPRRVSRGIRVGILLPHRGLVPAHA